MLSDEGTVSLHSAGLAGAGSTRRLAERGHPPLPADRFRANLVIDGCAAHAEDTVDRSSRSATCGSAFAQVDERCVVTTVDQRAGARGGPRAAAHAGDYRRIDGGGVALRGLPRGARPRGPVRVGDPVRLLPRS